MKKNPNQEERTRIHGEVYLSSSHLFMLEMLIESFNLFFAIFFGFQYYKKINIITNIIYLPFFFFASGGGQEVSKNFHCKRKVIVVAMLEGKKIKKKKKEEKVIYIV